MSKYIVVAVLSVALSACASTDTGTESAQKAEVTKPKRDCQIVKTTGNRLGKKVCAK
ncbi:MAG: hypothetical protein AB8G18_08845 [Gammaproteobacteria bacterium]